MSIESGARVDGKIIENSEELKRSPSLVILEPKIPQGVDESQFGYIRDIYSDHLESLRYSAMDQGLPTVEWPSEEKPDNFNGDRAIILNPVLLGNLGEKVEGILTKVIQEDSQRKVESGVIDRPFDTRDDNIPSFFDVPYRNSILSELVPLIAEAESPYLIDQINGKSVLKSLELNGENKGNFINVVYIDDKNDVISKLPQDWRQGLHWMLMAKFGSFKVMPVLYNSLDAYKAQVTLATLEGGFFDFNDDDPEMIKQLSVFANTTAVKLDTGVDEENSVSIEDWEESVGVMGIKKIGKIMGKHNLFSAGMSLADLVHSAKLKIINNQIANYSRQAEGAVYMYDPIYGFSITATGRLGAVKSNLDNDDVINMTYAEDGFKKRCVVGQEMKSESVEAMEFLEPIQEFMESDDPEIEGFKIRVVTDDNGTRFATENDENYSEIPAVQGILHLHRDIVQLPVDGSIFEVQIENKRVVGCGVDKMTDISREAIRKAYMEWDRSGRTAKFAIFRVGRHGINIFAFPSMDSNGNLEEFAYEGLDEMISANELILAHQVNMEHYPI